MSTAESSATKKSTSKKAAPKKAAPKKAALKKDTSKNAASKQDTPKKAASKKAASKKATSNKDTTDRATRQKPRPASVGEPGETGDKQASAATTETDWSSIRSRIISSPMVWVSTIGLAITFVVATRASAIESSNRMIGIGAVAIAALMLRRLRKSERDNARMAAWALVGVVGLFAVVAPDRLGNNLLRIVGVGALLAAMLDLVGWLEKRDSRWLLVRAGLFTAFGGLVLSFPLQMFRAVTLLAVVGFVVLLVASFYDAIYDPDTTTKPTSGGQIRPAHVSSVITQWARRISAGVDADATRDKVVFASDQLLHRASAFFTLMLLAATLASLGVVADSTATVIGAMLVAPLMTPLMGIALSIVSGWGERAIRMGIFALCGIGIAVTVGYFIGSIVSATSVDVTTNTQILARVSPTSIDLMIAIIAGISGAYGLSRADISDSLPGVAIAISLVPPLGVVGICISQGAWPQAFGAMTLFATNALAIVVCGAITFILMGVARPRSLSAGSYLALGVFAIAILGVTGLLLLNGSRITDGITHQQGVADAVSQWADSNDLRVVSVTRSSSDVIVVVAGDPISAETQQELADSIAAELDRDVSVDLRITAEQRSELSGATD